MNNKLEGKNRVFLNSIYCDGEVQFKDLSVPARTLLQPIPQTKAYTEVCIRMVIDTKLAEQVFDGLTKGIIEINIEKAPRLNDE